MNNLKRLIKILLNFFLMLIYEVIFIFIIIYLKKKIQKNDINKIFIMYEGGFGHTIAEPMLLDYLFKKKILFIYFHENNRFHNIKISKINFKKIIIFPIYLFLTHEKKYLEYKKKLFLILQNKLQNYCNTYGVQDICNFIKDDIKIKSKSLTDIHWYYVNKNKKKLTLNNDIKKLCARKFSSYLKNNKFIHLSLRYKPREDISSNYRNGFCNLTDYFPLINEITKDHYVSLNHDFKLKRNEYKFIDNNPRIITSNKIKIDENIFKIYSATECTYAICESGAGLLMPAFAKKKILMINTWPTKHIIPNSLVLLKHVFNLKRKKFVNIKSLIINNKFVSGNVNINKLNYKLFNNSIHEIIDVYKEFIFSTKLKKYSNNNTYKFNKASWAQINKTFLLSKTWFKYNNRKLLKI
jgi:putative glycosyltransferase (TIGR04372 family)